MQMPAKKPLQEVEEVSRRVAAYIHERLSAECEEDRGRAAVISRETGLTPSMVSQVRRGHSPAGPKFAGAIARYWGMTPDQLEAIAVGRGLPSTPTTIVELDEHYHNRGAAAAAARALGYPEQAIQQVQSVSLKSDNDLTADEWFDMMRAEKVRLERFAPLEQKPVPLTLEEHEKGMADLRAQAERETREAEERAKARKAARASRGEK
jgi:hypothetical protein